MVKQLTQFQHFYANIKRYWYCTSLKVLQYFFIGFGIVSFIGLLIIYFIGYQASQTFDQQFPYLFKQLIHTSLENDVPSALIIQKPLADGISLTQAEKALLFAAEQNDLTLVHHASLDEILSTDSNPWKLRTFAVLPVAVSQKILQQHPHFAAHLPFHIVLYQDLQGQDWIAMPNLSLLLHGLKYHSEIELLETLAAYETMYKTLITSQHGIVEEF